MAAQLPSYLIILLRAAAWVQSPSTSRLFALFAIFGVYVKICTKWTRLSSNGILILNFTLWYKHLFIRLSSLTTLILKNEYLFLMYSWCCLQITKLIKTAVSYCISNRTVFISGAQTLSRNTTYLDSFLPKCPQ